MSAVMNNVAALALLMPLDLQAEVAGFETRLLQRALSEGRYNQKRAAELLGLSYHQFRGMGHHVGIDLAEKLLVRALERDHGLLLDPAGRQQHCQRGQAVGPGVLAVGDQGGRADLAAHADAK